MSIGLSTGGVEGEASPPEFDMGGTYGKMSPPEFQEIQLKKYNVNISDAAIMPLFYPSSLRISNCCLADKSNKQQITDTVLQSIAATVSKLNRCI